MSIKNETSTSTTKKTGGADGREDQSTQANINTSNYSENMANTSSKSNSTGKNQNQKSQKTLSQVFEDQLKDIYSGEKQLIKALPDMIRAAYSEDLQEAFENHLEETKKQAERLEKIFNRLRIEDKDGEKCEAMEGLITECKEIISNYEESPVRDSALIIGAQKIEHYEIAAYGSLCELAEVLGYHKISDILDVTLEEEENTDRLLTDIAQDVNDEAVEMEDQEAY